MVAVLRNLIIQSRFSSKRRKGWPFSRIPALESAYRPMPFQHLDSGLRNDGLFGFLMHCRDGWLVSCRLAHLVVRLLRRDRRMQRCMESLQLAGFEVGKQ